MSGDVLVNQLLPDRRTDIQGLRAIAVVLVILYHLPTHANLDGGFVGVDIFFVISGFVVSRSIIERSKAGSELSFWSGYGQYLRRRSIRLVPALSSFVIGTLFMSALFAATNSMRQICEAGLSSMTYISNFYYVKTFSSYWNPEILRSPFLHTWSISVEFQDYLILPILLFPLIKNNFSRRVIRKILITTILVTIASLIIFSYLLFLRSTPIFEKNPIAIAFYSPITRIWEFALGIVTALCCISSKKRVLNQARNFCRLGYVLILACIIISSIAGSLNMSVVLGCTGTALLLGFGNQSNDKATLTITSRPFVYVGDRSYSIYLWHWPFLALSSWLSPGNLIYSLLFLFPAGLLSIASYRFVENGKIPFSKRRSRLGARTLVGYLGISSLAVVGAFFLTSTTWYLQPRPVSEVSFPFRDIGLDISKFTNATQGCELKELEIHCKNTKSTDAEVVIMGDSLAYRAFPAFELAARENGLNASMMWSGGCGVEFHSCPEFMYEYLASANVVGIFIASNFDRASNRLNTVERDTGVTPECPTQASTRTCDAHIEAVRKFTSKAKKGIPELLSYTPHLVVAKPFPQQSNSVHDCLLVPLYKRIFDRVSGGGECGKTSVNWQIERQGLFPEAIASISTIFNNVEIWDPKDYFCKDNWCPAWINRGEQLMTDGIHWSLEGSRFLYPKFFDTFKSWSKNAKVL